MAGAGAGGEAGWGPAGEAARKLNGRESRVVSASLHLQDALREVERHVVHLRGYEFGVQVRVGGEVRVAAQVRVAGQVEVGGSAG